MSSDAGAGTRTTPQLPAEYLPVIVEGVRELIDQHHPDGRDLRQDRGEVHRAGDGSRFEFEKIPSFAPEHFARLVSMDPMRRKQLNRGIDQLAKEGTIQLYRPHRGRAGELILGAVGVLQMEVTKYRLKEEYGAEVRLEPVAFRVARWASPMKGKNLDFDALHKACTGLVVLDIRDRPVVLFEYDWLVRYAQERLEDVTFAETAQGVVVRDV